MVFCTLLYKYTLRAWFQEDDFAWLGLGLQVSTWRDFLHVMFAPMAQGSIRPFSERAFYMGFFSLFQLNALPYRILVYVTQLGNIVLLTVIGYSLMKSYAASFWLPVLWIANSVLALPMTWTAAYNEILCTFIFLVSFYALLRYVDTGNWRFNLLQWVSFLIGFGVLEINVVYPLIAVLFTTLFARRYVRSALPLLIPSVVFSVIHRMVRIQPRNNIYALHFDASMARTLLAYWKRALGPYAAAEFFPQIHFYPALLTILISLALLGFAGWRILRGDRMPIFCLGWFVIALAPFLPVRDHVSDYYLTVPAVGLAMLGAWAIVVSLRRPLSHRILAAISIGLYLICSIPAARKSSQYTWSRSKPVKQLVLGVKAAHERNPGKTILLDGVGEELFWNGVYDRPFRLFGAEVYLTPDTVQKIPPYPELGNVADHALPKDDVRAGLAGNRILVYRVEPDGLQDITGLYREMALETALPRRIELGHPPMESLLGQSWYPSEGDYRWMPKQATVRLGVPDTGEGELHVEAFCVPIQVQSRRMTVWVSVEGKQYSPAEIRDCHDAVNLSFPIKVKAGTKGVQVKLEVDHTVQVPSDQRKLGLAVRAIEILDR